MLRAAAATLAMAVVGAFAVVGLPASAAQAAPTSQAAPTKLLSKQLQHLVTMRGGPVGAIVLVQVGNKVQVHAAGSADLAAGRAPTTGDLMRIASVSKAYSGAVALSLVHEGKLSLTDTIARRLPQLPAAWGAVTLAELLHHTSGLPEYIKAPEFLKMFGANPLTAFTPGQLIGYVAGQPLNFPPGSRYEYSDTDNIVVGLMVEAVTGTSYEEALSKQVLVPLSLSRTSLPGTPAMPEPALHGYDREPGKAPEDITTAVNPSGAWASGGMVSTPAELNTFIRAYVDGQLFGPALERAQRDFVPGSSGPPGPGANDAGLALFRYRTRCGTVYGHTGNFPGYTMFAAATSNGQRSVVVAVNVQLNDNKPVSPAYKALRGLEATAVCAALSRS